MFIIMPDLLVILIYGSRSELNSRGLINAPHAPLTRFTAGVRLNSAVAQLKLKRSCKYSDQCKWPLCSSLLIKSVSPDFGPFNRLSVELCACACNNVT